MQSIDFLYYALGGWFLILVLFFSIFLGYSILILKKILYSVWIITEVIERARVLYVRFETFVLIPLTWVKKTIRKKNKKEDDDD